MANQRIISGFPFPAFVVERAGQQAITSSPTFIIGIEKVVVDSIVAMEPSVSTRFDLISIIFWAQSRYNLRINSGFPFPSVIVDSLNGRNAITIGPTYLTEAPIIGVKADVGSTFEANDNVQTDLILFEDSAIGIRRTFTPNVFDFEMAAKADAISFVDFLYSSRTDISLPMEVCATPRFDTLPRIDFGAGVREDILSPTESSTSARADDVAPTVTGGNIQSDILTALEFSTSNLAHVTPSIEFAGSARGTFTNVTDFGASARFDLTPILQAQMQANADTIGLFALQGLLVTSDTLAFAEWLTRKYSARINPGLPFPSFVIEFTANEAITSGPTFISENAITAIRADIASPTEWLTAVVVNSDTLAWVEWLTQKRSARINAAMPFPSFVVETTSNDAITSGSLFISENPVTAIFGDVLSQMDWASIFNADIAAPEESTAMLQADEPSKPDFGTSTKSDVVMRMEFATSSRLDAFSPTAWQENLNTDQLIVIELSTGEDATLTARAPVEFSASARSTTRSPIEFGTGMKGDVLSPVAWQASLNTDQLVPVEFLGTSIITLTPRNPLEFSTGCRATSRQFVDFAMGARGDLVSPLELLMSARGDIATVFELAARPYGSAHLPFDNLATTQALSRALIEMATGARASLKFVEEYGMSAGADVLGIADFGFGIYGRSATSLELAASARMDAFAPVEWRTTFRMDNIVPLEFHSSNFVSTTRSPIEFGMGVRGDTVPRIEFSVGARADLATAIYNLASLQADANGSIESAVSISALNHIANDWKMILRTVQEKQSIEFGTGVRSDLATSVEALVCVFDQAINVVELLASSRSDENLNSEWIGDLTVAVTNLIEFSTSAEAQIKTLSDFGAGAKLDASSTPEISVSLDGTDIVAVTMLANLFRLESVPTDNMTSSQRTDTATIESEASAQADFSGQIDWIGLLSAVWLFPINFSTNTQTDTETYADFATRLDSAFTAPEESLVRSEGNVEAPSTHQGPSVSPMLSEAEFGVQTFNEIAAAMSAAASVAAIVTAYAEIIIHASVNFIGNFPLEFNTSASSDAPTSTDFNASLVVEAFNVPISMSTGVVANSTTFTAFGSGIVISMQCPLEFSGVFFRGVANPRVFGLTNDARAFHSEQPTRAFTDGMAIRGFGDSTDARVFTSSADQ